MNPTWREEFSVEVESIEHLRKCSLELVVKDDSRFAGGKSVMGKVFINANTAHGNWHLENLIRTENAVYFEYPLQM